VWMCLDGGVYFYGFEYETGFFFFWLGDEEIGVLGERSGDWMMWLQDCFCGVWVAELVGWLCGGYEIQC